MTKQTDIKSIGELIGIRPGSDIMRCKINCIGLDEKKTNDLFSRPVFVSADISVLVLSGTANICINYRTHQIGTDSITLISNFHMFDFESCSKDFRALCLMVSKEFMDEMDSTDMIYRRIKYGVRFYNDPIQHLEPHQAAIARHRLRDIMEALDNTGHIYYDELILNRIMAFYIDLSDIIDRNADSFRETHLTRYESIVKSFIELLMDNYRREHSVDFYASRLNISAHYLSFIAKRITGRTACDLIFEMLFSEARKLLYSSTLSVQEIAAILNFSDQSSFGKFFKRKSGLSPIDYRKRNR